MSYLKTGSVSLAMAALFLAGCSPKISTNLVKAKVPLEPDTEITVLSPENPEPTNAVLLETVTVGSNGFTNGKKYPYETLVEMIKDHARQAGGNVVKILEHRAPDRSSTSHRVAAVVLWADESAPEQSETQKTMHRQVESDMSLRPVSRSLSIGLQGGGAYRLGRAAQTDSPVLDAHMNNMRWGPSYGADVTYYFSENFGAGLKFHNLYNGDKMPASMQKDGKTIEGYLEDYSNITYVGPYFSFRLLSRNRNNAFFARTGIGLAIYNNWGQYFGESLLIRGNTLGLMDEVGYDFGISKHLSVGASLILVGGVLINYSQTDGSGHTGHLSLSPGNYESLVHVGLTIGLRYNL